MSSLELRLTSTPVLWSLSPFARRYLGNRFFFLFLRLLRCFSSAGIPPLYYFIHITVTGYESGRVSTFGNLRVKRIFAPNRSLSQLITSFVGNWCQGIHPTLFIAWPCFGIYSIRIIWVFFFPFKVVLLPLTFKKDLNIILSHLLRYSNILSLYSVVNVQEGLIKPSKINSIIRIIYFGF